MAIYKEIYDRDDNKLTTGGAALNTACATRFSLKQNKYKYKGITYFGSVGQDSQGDTINLHLKHLGLIPKLHRVTDTPTS
jgi:adenosine kinase